MFRSKPNYSIYFKIILVLLFSILFISTAKSEAYIVSVGGKVSASPWPSPGIERVSLNQGTMLEPKTHLSFDANSQLTVICEPTNKLVVVTSSKELQQHCFQQVRQLKTMRSTTPGTRPVLLQPRQEQLLALKQIVWRSDVDAKFRIEIIELDGKNNRTIYDAAPSNVVSKREILTTYSVDLPQSIQDKLRVGQVYRILIHNKDNGENSGSDDYSGVFKLAEKKIRKQLQHHKTELSQNVEDEIIARFMYAVRLRELQFHQESLAELGLLKNKIDHEKKYTKYKFLSADVQFQIAENYYRQNSKRDFITVQLLKTINLAGDTNNRYTGYLACERLAAVFNGLNSHWQNRLEKLMSKPVFRSNCPILASE